MYSIYADGVCIYSDQFALENRTVTNPKLVLEDNSAGSLSFTLPVTNVGYELIVRLVTDISVFKEGKEIWAGRVLSENQDFRNNRVLTCEGALAFLNDSTQPPKEYAGVGVHDYLAELLDIHNSKVGANRQIALGDVTVRDTDTEIVYYTNYEKTIECVGALVEKLGGHLLVRRGDDGLLYLDYLAEYPRTSSQTIEFGKNLIDFAKTWNESDYASVIIPLGARLEGNARTEKTDVPEALDAYLTIESETGGKLYVKSDEAVEAFGWIERAVLFDGITSAKTLLEKGQEYLEDLQFDNVELELSALDMHYLDVNIEDVKFLDEIQVTSRPHGMNRMFPVTKMEIPLDSPANTVFKLGMAESTSLTSSNSQTSSQILQKIESLPKAHNLLKEAQITATAIMNRATTGYVTVIKNDTGSEALYISNTPDYRDATQLWKWSIGGLGYWTNSREPDEDDQKKKFGELADPFFGMAMTMDGAIVADFITAGTMSADRIRTGVLQDPNGHVVFNLETGKLTMKSGSIHIGTTDAGETAFEVDEKGNVTARRGTFEGRVVATSGSFYGAVQAESFKLWDGRDMVDLIDEAGKINKGWLNLMGLTITNKNGDTVLQISEDGIRWAGTTSPIKYQFGASSTGPWHDQMQSSDKYRRDSLDGGTTWGDPYQFRGTDGQNGTVDYSRVNQILKETYGITTTYITDGAVGSPVIQGAQIYGGTFYCGSRGGFQLRSSGGSDIIAMYPANGSGAFVENGPDGCIGANNDILLAPAGGGSSAWSGSVYIVQGNQKFRVLHSGSTIHAVFA